MFKNQLQELAQRSCFNLPSYSCIREGPDHAPRFKATANFNGELFESPDFCSTLRQAEHSAAEVALIAFAKRGPSQSLAAKILDETGVCKNMLQETAQRAGLALPVYETVRAGPGHIPVFQCTVILANMRFTGEASRTKKQAEKNAAMSAFTFIKNYASQNIILIGNEDTSEDSEQASAVRALSAIAQSSRTRQLIAGSVPLQPRTPSRAYVPLGAPRSKLAITSSQSTRWTGEGSESSPPVQSVQSTVTVEVVSGSRPTVGSATGPSYVPSHTRFAGRTQSAQGGTVGHTSLSHKAGMSYTPAAFRSKAYTPAQGTRVDAAGSEKRQSQVLQEHVADDEDWASGESSSNSSSASPQPAAQRTVDTPTGGKIWGEHSSRWLRGNSSSGSVASVNSERNSSAVSLPDDELVVGFGRPSVSMAGMPVRVRNLVQVHASPPVSGLTGSKTVKTMPRPVLQSRSAKPAARLVETGETEGEEEGDLKDGEEATRQVLSQLCL